MNKNTFNFLVLVIMVLSVACSSQSVKRSTAAETPPRVPPRTFPNPKLTPGKIDPNCTKEKVCVPGYANGTDKE